MLGRLPQLRALRRPSRRPQRTLRAREALGRRWRRCWQRSCWVAHLGSLVLIVASPHGQDRRMSRVCDRCRHRIAHWRGLLSRYRSRSLRFLVGDDRCSLRSDLDTISNLLHWHLVGRERWRHDGRPRRWCFWPDDLVVCGPCQSDGIFGMHPHFVGIGWRETITSGCWTMLGEATLPRSNESNYRPVHLIISSHKSLGSRRRLDLPLAAASTACHDSLLFKRGEGGAALPPQLQPTDDNALPPPTVSLRGHCDQQ